MRPGSTGRLVTEDAKDFRPLLWAEENRAGHGILPMSTRTQQGSGLHARESAAWDLTWPSSWARQLSWGRASVAG